MSNDDLKAAAKAARYLASTAASIHGLRAAGATAGAMKLSDELAEFYPAARAAIAKVAPELKQTRAAPARSGDVVAPTAHEVAVEMVLAVNRERFGFEVIGRKQIQAWPDIDEVLAEIELEYAKALGCRKGIEDEWSAPMSPSAWAKELKVSLSTLKRHEVAGRLVIDKRTTKSWSIRRDTLRKYLGGN